MPKLCCELLKGRGKEIMKSFMLLKTQGFLQRDKNYEISAELRIRAVLTHFLEP
jgi:hypothetical protein